MIFKYYFFKINANFIKNLIFASKVLWFIILFGKTFTFGLLFFRIKKPIVFFEDWQDIKVEICCSHSHKHLPSMD
jgi:hypothetical protein